MGSGSVLAVGRALALVSMVFALVGIAVSLSSYAQEGFSMGHADITMHTKAFCSPQEGMIYCEDKLVVEYGDRQYIAQNSQITGNAFIKTTETF